MPIGLRRLFNFGVQSGVLIVIPEWLIFCDGILEIGSFGMVPEIEQQLSAVGICDSNAFKSHTFGLGSKK